MGYPPLHKALSDFWYELANHCFDKKELASWWRFLVILNRVDDMTCMPYQRYLSCNLLRILINVLYDTSFQSFSKDLSGWHVRHTQDTFMQLTEI